MGDTNHLLEAALAYAERGWPVFPCAPGDKMPLLSKRQGGNGLYDATTDAEQVAAWWKRYPTANIGLRTGVAFDVLDIDGADGTASIIAACEEYGFTLPGGPWSKTGGGGDHVLFVPTGAGNRAGLLYKVDWRGAGGYIVAPPSVHPSGNVYAWDSDEDGDRGPEHPLEPVPEWLATLVNPPKVERGSAPVKFLPRNAGDGTPYGLQAMDRELEDLARSQPGSRNSDLNTAAFNLYQLVAGGELLEAAVEQRLRTMGMSLGLSENEVMQTIRSGRSKGVQHPRSAPELVLIPGRHHSGGKVSATATKGNAPADDLFRRYTASELLSMPRTFEWLARRLLVQPTYGQIAGEQKTLKTYLSLMIYVGVASGTSILDAFEVERPGPVMVNVGEGGRVPYTRRLERVASAMGVDLDGVPLHFTFDVAPIGSSVFMESMRRDLDQLAPILFGIDPYYAFHGVSTKASDLHQEGALLSSISAPCVEAGTTLLINNHFNQTGLGGGLSRITQAGSGEWVDSWLLLSHRNPPDVDNGRFQLTLDIGSRQWGGTSWELDLNIGRFNPDTAEYDGDIEWHLSRGSGRDGDSQRVMEQVGDRPFEMTKEELAMASGGQVKRMRQVIDKLEEQGEIKAAKQPRKRSDGRPYFVWAFGPASLPGRDETTEVQV